MKYTVSVERTNMSYAWVFAVIFPYEMKSTCLMGLNKSMWLFGDHHHSNMYEATLIAAHINGTLCFGEYEIIY
jgi:hypothetical protein